MNNASWLPWPRYAGCHSSLHSASSIKFWTISDGNFSSIHRFFDSSPFSPSGRYIAYTQILGEEGSRIDEKSASEVIVVNIRTKETLVVDRTTAWDTQVGAHVQWGANDSQLFYNKYMASSAESFSTASHGLLRGVMADIHTSKKVYFDSPVYHVSTLGDYYAAPDLTKIRFTQLGYGVYSPRASPNTHASRSDGVFVTDIRAGRTVLLVSLHDLAIAGGWDPTTPTYAFHTKWSSDGAYLMIVARTQEARRPADWVGWVQSAVGSKRKWFRRQHLFVVRKDGQQLRYLTSWQSEPMNSQSVRKPRLEECNQYVISRLRDMMSNVETKITDDRIPLRCRTIPARKTSSRNTSSKLFIADTPLLLRDGNHPNWIPGTHSISMNMQDFDDSVIIGDTHDTVDPSTGSASQSTSEVKLKRFRVLVFDLEVLSNSTGGVSVSSYFTNAVVAALRQNTTFYYHEGSGVLEYQAYPVGSGHPTFSLSGNQRGRFALMDAYSKELPLVFARSDQNTTVSPLCAPLRLVDTITQREVLLLDFQISRAVDPSSKYDQIARSWRCDLHPAWSRDYQWVAVNARSSGGNRQVVIGYLGPDLHAHFERK